MTSERAAKVLAVIDAGLQTPMPDPSFGEVSPVVTDRCPRCNTRDPADQSEFCAPCRAYLLGDAPEPPTVAGYAYIDLSFCDVEYDLSVQRFERIRDAIAEFTHIATEQFDVLAPMLLRDPGSPLPVAAAARRYCDIRARSLHDHHAEIGIARYFLEQSHPFAWAVIAQEVDRMLYIETARRPRWATTWVEPTDDPFRVLLRVSWSSLDPYLLLDPDDPDYG